MLYRADLSNRVFLSMEEGNASDCEHSFAHALYRKCNITNAYGAWALLSNNNHIDRTPLLLTAPRGTVSAISVQRDAMIPLAEAGNMCHLGIDPLGGVAIGEHKCGVDVLAIDTEGEVAAPNSKTDDMPDNHDDGSWSLHGDSVHHHLDRLRGAGERAKAGSMCFMFLVPPSKHTYTPLALPTQIE